jgi:Protein of unknown function (DUF4238)
MNIPHDHHFIPAFYLKHWAGPNGKLVEYTLRRGKLVSKHVGPRATGFETDLYTFTDLPKDIAQHLETAFFSYADRTASKALDDLLADQTLIPELVNAWSRFVIGIHLRHPDTKPELRAAAIRFWDLSGHAFQAEYENIRKPHDPPTFDAYLAKRDPFGRYKMQLNLIIKALDNETIGQHINGMTWHVRSLSDADHKLLTSDRPVEIPDGSDHGADGERRGPRRARCTLVPNDAMTAH